MEYGGGPRGPWGLSSGSSFISSPSAPSSAPSCRGLTPVISRLAFHLSLSPGRHLLEGEGSGLISRIDSQALPRSLAAPGDAAGVVREPGGLCIHHLCRVGSKGRRLEAIFLSLRFLQRRSFLSFPEDATPSLLASLVPVHCDHHLPFLPAPGPALSCDAPARCARFLYSENKGMSCHVAGDVTVQVSGVG